MPFARQVSSRPVVERQLVMNALQGMSVHRRGRWPHNVAHEGGLWCQSSEGFSQETRRGPEINGLKFQASNPPERSSGKICARDGRKMRRKFGENFCRFSSFNFQGKWVQEISQKILDIFHSAPNKVLSLLQLWEVGAQ